MKAVLQVVQQASVTINDAVFSIIEKGLLVLVGVEDLDTIEDIDWLASKIINMRIFTDDNGVMNYSVKDITGEILVVSQFTLQASTKKGNRPSYMKASKPNIAIPIYELFVSKLNSLIDTKVKSGKFGADMKVSLINDGPITIVIDSKNRT